MYDFLITSATEIATGVSRSEQDHKVGELTSVNVLVGHAEVILTGLLAATNPLHAVFPPLDITFQKDPSITEEIMLGEIGRMFGMWACLIHAYKTFGEFNVPCPLSVEIRQRYKSEGKGWVVFSDIRGDVLLWTVHHCGPNGEMEFKVKKGVVRTRGGPEDGECGRRMLGDIYILLRGTGPICEESLASRKRFLYNFGYVCH